MKKNINILNQSFDNNNNVIQFFFIYPRFYYKEGSKIYNFTNNLLNKRYIGDNFQKLKFKEIKSRKYKNGILFAIIYNKLNDFDYSEQSEKIEIQFEVKEDFACISCKHNINQRCEFWEQNTFNSNKFVCEFWEEL